MIDFFLKWEEYFAAQEFFRRSRGGLSSESVFGLALFLLGLLLLFIDGAGLAAICALVLGLAVIFSAPLVRRLTSKIKWDREPLFQTQHKVAASDEGVYFQMGVIESNLDWRYYQRLLESPAGFLLVYGGDSFNFLPKRAFSGEEQIARFRALAARKLKR
jgi:hypothetical protein